MSKFTFFGGDPASDAWYIYFDDWDFISIEDFSGLGFEFCDSLAHDIFELCKKKLSQADEAKLKNS